MAIRNSVSYDDDRLFDGDQVDSGEGSLSDQLDLQHYLRILRKHKWAITLFTALVVALAGYYAFTATPVYSSTATLLIESQSDNLVQFEELVGLDSETQDYYETQYELLRSRGLALRVVNYMDLWDHPEFVQTVATEAAGNEAGGGVLDQAKALLGMDSETATLDLQGGTVTASTESVAQGVAAGESSFDRQQSLAASSDTVPEFTMDPKAILPEDEFMSADRRQVVDAFMSRLSVTPVRKTKLVKISFESTDPDFAARVANTVAEQYIESYLDAKMELTTKAQTWLNQRLGELKQVLDQSEQRLAVFKQENGLVDVDGSVGRLNEQELLLATAELAQARSELASQSDIYREVQSLRDRPALLESIPAIQADPLVQNVKIAQGQAQRELDELRNRYGDRHPRVIDATSQLETLDNSLRGHINRVVGTISSDYQLTQQRVANIEAKLAAGKQEIQAIGTKKFELDELEREAAVNRDIYDTFFSRISEARSADGLENANARISDPALPSLSPVKPKKQLIIALAGLASLVLSMLMALLYEQMDDTIKSTGDIENKLGMKLLGILPLIKSGMFSRSSDLPLNPLEIVDKKGTFVESVNTARTTLCMGDSSGGRQVIVVTSSIPGEGKSTTSINLAFSLGQLERVLIIDCDMRRPTLAKAAGLDRNTTGLSSLITQTASAKDCIKRGMFGGSVDILPSGPLPDQPLELLSSKRFEKILDQLKMHYDRIIIDSAPTQAVSDALVISRLSDAVVYCVKSHATSIELVRRGLQRLRQVDAPLAGVIITQVDVDKIQSYGGDYYYQGYYDYYGYNDNASNDDNGRAGNKIRLTQEELYAIKNDDREVDLDLDFGRGRSMNGNGHGNGNGHRNGNGHDSVMDDDDLDITAEIARSDRVEARRNGRGEGEYTRRKIDLRQ